jgi:8-oxo-dGTP pyrophosphatase MutT (NUDIX family)
MSYSSLTPWRRVKAEQGPELPLFEAEFRWMENPRNKEVLKALILKSPDTINVIAVTGERELILVEQFRFGIDECLLELPAGLMDFDEEPLQAARRELLEETGYLATSWTLLGESHLNPAYVTNRCYHFLAQGAYLKGAKSLDNHEDIRVYLIPVEDLTSITNTPLIKDAVGSAALLYLRKYIDNQTNK